MIARDLTLMRGLIISSSGASFLPSSGTADYVVEITNPYRDEILNNPNALFLEPEKKPSQRAHRDASELAALKKRQRREAFSVRRK